MIKAVVFDFGGVLVRTEDSAGRRKWEEQLNLTRGELARLVFDSEVAALATIGGTAEEEIWKQLAVRLQLSPAEIVELQQDFWSGDRLDTDLVEFLSSLRPRYKTAILSNAWTGARLVFTEKFGLHQAVDTILISAEESLAKPDPRIYQLLADRLEVEVSEVVLVDDFHVNIQAARETGMQAVHFQNPQQALQDLSKLLDQPLES
jgi:epoxide hydrolase-like predicted phosphatase